MEVKFAENKEDKKLIKKIADRGWKIGWLKNSYKDFISLEMDISATHSNGSPLRLDDLLKADDFNFAHDLSGICRHLDRETGKLKNCFLPRFSQH